MKQIFLLFGIILILGVGCIDASQIDETTDVIKANINLDHPLDNEIATSPLMIDGNARVFEGVVSWRARLLNGDILAEGFINADASDVDRFGSFSQKIFLPVIDAENFLLEVFTFSPVDGSMQDLIERTLIYENRGKTSVNVYFVDPDAVEFGNCSSVDFEKRTMAFTNNIAELALVELFKGPTAAWATTMIPEFTTLESIVIEDGVAKVSLNSPDISMWSGGSCRMNAIRTQIEQTLFEFDSIDVVEIAVNGKFKDILEP